MMIGYRLRARKCKFRLNICYKNYIFHWKALNYGLHHSTKCQYLIVNVISLPMYVAEECDDQSWGETDRWRGRADDQGSRYRWWWTGELWGVCEDDDGCLKNNPWRWITLESCFLTSKVQLCSLFTVEEPNWKCLLFLFLYDYMIFLLLRFQSFSWKMVGIWSTISISVLLSVLYSFNRIILQWVVCSNNYLNQEYRFLLLQW